jgi:hypothetical protein
MCALTEHKNRLTLGDRAMRGHLLEEIGAVCRPA